MFVNGVIYSFLCCLIVLTTLILPLDLVFDFKFIDKETCVDDILNQ